MDFIIARELGKRSLERVPLHANGTFAMYVVLPKDEAAMRSFLQRLTAERFSTYISSLESRSEAIDLPRFSITYREMLNKTWRNSAWELPSKTAQTFPGFRNGPAFPATGAAPQAAWRAHI